MRYVVIALLVVACLLPASLGQVSPLVVIGCFDGQAYPPEFCPNYSREIGDLAGELVAGAYGEEVEVVTIGDWFFLLDVLSLPNVIGGIVSLREGAFYMSTMRQEELVSSFEDGLGLIGMNAMCYNTTMGRVAHEVFPINGTKKVAGKIFRGELVTSRHTHVMHVENEVTHGLPGVLEIPDSSMFYNYPLPGEGWWTPDGGNMTVLYKSTTVVRDREVPSVVLYERGSGRSVAFPGLRHTDATGRLQKDLGWYNHSLGIPEFRQLLTSCILHVLEPFASEGPLGERLDYSREFLDEALSSLQLEVETADAALDSYRRRSTRNTILVVVMAVLAAAAIAYVGFIRK